jgi:hypothetical protein
MKLLRCFVALALASALAGIAKADPIDYHAVIVDPPAGRFSTTPITSLTSPTVIKFKSCVPGEIPGTVDPYEGCASFENSTAAPITSLQLEFPDTTTLGGQPVSCALDGTDTPGGPTSANVFQTTSCALVGGDYILDFSDGSISVGDLFTVAENGVRPRDFPDGTLTSTPEPSSIWLLSTGALLLGGFFYYKRHNGFGEIGF